MSSPLVADRQLIRQQMRQLRRELSVSQQQQAAQRLCQRAINFAPVASARHIALFLSVDGELDTRPLIDSLWQMQKKVYLPVLHPFAAGELLFLRYDPKTVLRQNKLRIPELVLDVRQLIPLQQLDVIMVPLVAFDLQGERLGMGGGFYDRTLQHWRQRAVFPIGLAHDCQQVNQLPVAGWDIPLPAIITPSRLWQWPSAAR